MKVCIPAPVDRGLDSDVSGHFGSAPWFILHDFAKDYTEAFSNQKDEHVHGQCHPMKALRELGVDALIVSGLGRRALSNMRECGVRVFHAVPGTVRDNLAALKAGTLEEFDELSACAGHDH